MKIKATGIVRRLDNLGRLVIPKELRKILSVNEGDALEIYTEGDKIMLKKYTPGCVFCGEVENTFNFQNKFICVNCSKDILKSSKTSSVKSNKDSADTMYTFTATMKAK